MFSNGYNSARGAARKLWRVTARAAMDIPPVRRQVRNWSLAGHVPKRLWNRLPIAESMFEFAVPGAGSVRYSAADGDAIGHALYWRGLDGWESATIYTFLALADNARQFLDVGANTGVYTLLACARNRGLHAVAFEPVPRIFERLQNNLEANDFGPRCQARQVAVADRVGVTQLHVPDTAMPSSASLHETGFRNIRGRLIDVSVTTADHETGPESVDIPMPVDLVKIDVEGFEDQVLLGMTRILGGDRPVIVCECNPDGPYQAVAQLLSGADYRFWHVRAPRLERMATIRPDPSERYRNFVCVPAENRATSDLLAALRLP